MLVMRLPIQLAWKRSMKKRVPESMPSSEAVPRACLMRMGERAGYGAFCLMASDKAGVSDLAQ